MRTFKTLFFILISGMLFASEPPVSKIKHDKLTAYTADDTTSLVLSPEGTAILGKDAVVGIVKGSDDYYILVGYPQDTTPKALGISIAQQGNVIFINAPVIVISRKTFSSHEAADAALLSGEEYYLQGDRLVYRKP